MAGFAPPTKKSGSTGRAPGPSASPPWAPFVPRFDLAPKPWLVSRSASPARTHPATATGPAKPERGLTVSSPSDPAEVEADVVAARVLAAAPPAPPVSPAPAPSQIQRRCSGCEEEEEQGAHVPDGKIQRHGEGTPSITPGVAAAVGAVGGGGEPLPSAERRFFETRLGHDLSRVRVHTDRPAAEAARAIDADAFTLRNEVAFAEGLYQPGSESGRHLLAHELVHVIQQGAAAPLPGAGAPPVQGSRGGPQIARQATGTMETSPTPAPPAARVPSADASEPATAGGGLVVEDDAQALTTGQMRKSQVLSELRAASCSAADRELARAGRDTRGCPFVEKWLDHYKDQPAQHLERAIRKYAPGAAAARSAHDYVPPVAARIARGVATWVSTGQIPSDIPDEMKTELPGGGLAGAVGGALSSVAGAIGGALSAIGHLFFKGAPGGARSGADPAGLSARLGPGRPLDPPVRQRMESAFEHGLGEVRVHDDSAAAGLSRDVNALAFTLGTHVAFAGGEYRPGTPVGDVLLAHELAHVVQQSNGGARDGTASLAPEPSGGAVEQDADEAAIGVAAKLWGNPEEAVRHRRRSLGRAPFRLARCGGDKRRSDGELQAYLHVLDTTHDIEDHSDSDDKARAIVAKWRQGGSDFVLTAERKALLIREMLKGVTGTDDENAILEILERSYNFELKIIFTSGKVTASALNSALDGDNNDRLQQFFERRFIGGRAALNQGKVEPKEFPSPLGIKIEPPNDAGEPFLRGTTEWNVPCVLGILCPLDKGVVDQLPGLTIKKVGGIDVVIEYYDDSSGTWKQRTWHPTGFNNAADRLIGINADYTCGEAASTIIHEVRHQHQTPGSVMEQERDAYTYEAQWQIDRGIPGSFQVFDPTTGQQKPDTVKIEHHVQSRYPGQAAGAPTERVVGRTPAGDTRLKRADGSTYTRAPRADDSFVVGVTPVGVQVIPPATWKCP
jgi:hypothetical protein